MQKRNPSKVQQEDNYGPFMAAADALIKKGLERKAKEEAFLAELGFKLTFEDVIALLKDDARLKVVVSKLKMQMFW